MTFITSILEISFGGLGAQEILRRGECLGFHLLLNAGEVFRSIEVQERAQLGIKGRNFLGGNFSLFHPGKEVDDLQITMEEQILHEGQAFLGVDGMKRLPAIFGFGDDNVKPGRKGNQVADEGFV